MSAKRPRIECPYCKEILSYSSYRRHVETKLCIASNKASKEPTSSETSVKTAWDGLDFSEIDSHDSDLHGYEDNYISEQELHRVSVDLPTTSDMRSDISNDSEDSGPEIWDMELDIECESDENGYNLLYSVSYFLLFFQLCYKLSDRAMKHILSLILSLLYWIPTFIIGNNSANLTALTTSFPRTLYALKKNLDIKSDLTRYCVCPTCHTLYKEKDCPHKCHHIEFPDHPHAVYRQKCGTDLMKSIKVEKNYKLVPRKIYVYNSISSTLQKLMSRPGFFESCEAWREANSSDGFMTDVYDGKLWREEWKRYLEVPGNLLLMLNVDWFRVYKHSSYSIGMIYLVIQNLPRTLRFKPENILIVGSIPGPHEPKLSINSYLKPMVDELLDLWKGVQLECSNSVLGYKTIRVALALICSDIPATRKLCGFYGFNALYGCSKCMKKFTKPSIKEPTDFSGFQRDNWTPRDLKAHHTKALEARQAKSNAARDKVQSELGIRYSELLRLPYLDIIRCHLIDPMHNLYLGTAKNVFSLWKEHGILNESLCGKVQQKMDSLIIPVYAGRLPSKIATASGFSGFTAEQWMIWTIVYSPFALKGILPPIHYEMWCMFSKSCSLLCRPFIHHTELKKADEQMMEFCNSFETNFGKSCVTPNVHLHGHLWKCLEDVGPVFSFWCYSFERYNGLLESFKKSWHAPEIQIMEKFSMMQTLNSTDTSKLPIQFASCLDTIKQNYVMLDDGNNIVDSQTLFQYEKNLFSLPSAICALKLPFHKVVPPLREKFFTEGIKTHLYNMYTKLYSAELVTHIPLRYEEFEIFRQIYTSSKSRSHKSTTIMAIWPSLTGKILDRSYRTEDVRVGIIEYFILHTPTIEGQKDQPHILAKVKWFDDHVRKNWFKNSIVVSCTLYSNESEASFLPVSRIMSRCARSEETLQLDYGADKVNISIPFTRRIDD